MLELYRIIKIGLNLSSPLGEVILRLYTIELYSNQYYSTGDNNIYKTLDLQLYNSTILGFLERESILSFLPERISTPSNSNIYKAVKNKAGRIQKDKNTTY